MPSRERTYCLRTGYSGTLKTRNSQSQVREHGATLPETQSGRPLPDADAKGQGWTWVGWEVLGGGSSAGGAPSLSAESRAPQPADPCKDTERSKSWLADSSASGVASGLLVMKQSAGILELADTSKREVCCWPGAACPEPGRQFAIPTQCRNQALLGSLL